MSGLPKGWSSALLNDVMSQVIGGGTPSRNMPAYYEGEIPWFTIKDLKSLLPNDAQEHISQEAVDNSATNVIPANTLIVATRIALGKAIKPKVSCAINQDLKAIIFHSGVDVDFMLHWVLANERSIQKMGSGTTVLGIRLEQLHSLPLSLPPTDEQTRIVTKLEELLSDLDAGVAELKAAQKKLAQYRQSLLEEVSQGNLLDDVHVEETTLGEIVISIGQGWSPKCENHPSESPQQWAVIKTTAIQPLSFDGSHNKELPANLTAREHLELQDGDLLVTRAGPRNRVGITCLVKSPRSKLILCDKAYRLKINEAKALPAFVELVLNSPRALQTIDTLKSGINDSGLNLTQDRFFTLPVNLPTLKVQQLLVNTFADANNEICDFESVIERSLSQAAAQRQNILRAAFAGQLVPQDPNDEPASVLLQRIRAERATQANTKKARATKPRKAKA